MLEAENRKYISKETDKKNQYNFRSSFGPCIISSEFYYVFFTVTLIDFFE